MIGYEITLLGTQLLTNCPSRFGFLIFLMTQLFVVLLNTKSPEAEVTVTVSSFRFHLMFGYVKKFIA